MRQRRTAVRALLRAVLSRSLGRQRARVAYDLLSASRELLWNSLRRRLYPSFWRRARADRRRGVLRYALHGEFGDALLALPFLYRAWRRHPDRRIEIVIKATASGALSRSAGDPLSEGNVRLMATASGQPVNFLLEFWSRVPFVDRVREGDVGDPREHYWQPQPALALQGQTAGPSDYRPFLDELFTSDDRRQAEGIWTRAGRPVRVAAHLRRSADQIAALVSEIGRSELGPATAVAIMGSRRHEPIPDVPPHHAEVLDLTDNYEKGISIMPLLQTIRAADLFIGGRGGFELFALAAGVPALTVFDDDGWWEQRRLWPERLWSENPLGVLIESADFDAGEAFRTHVAPWLHRRFAAGQRDRAAAAS